MSMRPSKKVIVSDIVISREHLLRLATEVHAQREGKGNSSEVIAEALCLAWGDYLDDLLANKVRLPFTLSQHLEKHEKYFERFGI